MSVKTLPRTTDPIVLLNALQWETNGFDPGKLAHIVKKKKGWRNRKTSPQAMVLEARIAGTPLEALCGYVWVPSQNPHNLPVCPKCKAIYDKRPGKKSNALPDA